MESSAKPIMKYAADCSFLLSCFSGKATAADEKKVAEILTSRNLQELSLMRQTYHALFNHHLPYITKTNNLLARLAYLRISEPCDRDSEMIKQALSSTCFDPDTLTELICTRSSSQLRLIKQTYYAKFNSSLAQEVSLKANGSSLKEILVAVLNSADYFPSRPDTSMAMCDAKTIYEAIGSGKSVDQMAITSLLSKRNTDQLKAILMSYKLLYGHELTKFLKLDKCGAFGRELRAVVRCVLQPEKHFAKQLRRAMKDGNVQEVVIRVVVTRAETDIKCINRAFAMKTGWSLESLIRSEFNSDCSTEGDKALVGDVLVAFL